MTQKLDSLSKIIIATGQINYMANSISTVNEQIKFILDKDGFHRDGIEARTTVLLDTVVKLGFIMEELGNFINDTDCICHIDERVAQVPFEIIIQGMDDCEIDYSKHKKN